MRDTYEYWQLPRHFWLTAIAYLFVVATLCTFLARFWWIFELPCAARLQLCWFLLLLCFPLAWVGQRKNAWVVAALGLFNLVYILPLYYGRELPSKAVPDLRVMAINVLTSNRDFAEVIAIVERSAADVVVLLEVDQAWIDGIAELETRFPHRRHHVIDNTADNFGLAIYSREHLKRCRFVELADSSIKAVVATIESAGKDVRIIGAHPLPPMSAYGRAMRDRQLRHLAQLSAEHLGPTILLGDLNVSSWSPIFPIVLRDGNLIDTRHGFGVLPSHNAGGLLQIPIDHILVSADIRTHNRWVEPCHGSDHDAVLADLSFESPMR